MPLTAIRDDKFDSESHFAIFIQQIHAAVILCDDVS